MDEIITGLVGLDAHAESTAIGLAEAGRAAPRLVGTVGAKPAELIRALGKLGHWSCHWKSLTLRPVPAQDRTFSG